MLRLPNDIYLQMVGHCLTGLPDEACGLLAGDPGRRRGVRAATRRATSPPRPSSTRSTLGSTCRPTGTPRPTGSSCIGVFHSHTHTDAYPSPTDVAQAPDPGWHYVLVSLRDTHPVVRSYSIVDGEIAEESVVVLTHAHPLG